MGDFNLEPSNNHMKVFFEDLDPYNLMKNKTCFKSARGIDLIITNKKFNFMHTGTYETGLSDFHPLIYTVMKNTYIKLPPKKLLYRCYKKFDKDLFLSDLEYNFSFIKPGIYENFETVFEQTLNLHAPVKEKFIRGNNKPHVTKELRKAIMKRSHLKHVAIKI